MAADMSGITRRRLHRDHKVGIGFKTTGPTNQNSTLWSQRKPELTNEQIWVRCAKPVGCAVRSVCAGKRDGCQQCVFATITLASTHTAATLSWIVTVTACFAHFIYIQPTDSYIRVTDSYIHEMSKKAVTVTMAFAILNSWNSIHEPRSAHFLANLSTGSWTLGRRADNFAVCCGGMWLGPTYSLFWAVFMYLWVNTKIWKKNFFLKLVTRPTHFVEL